MSENSHSSHSHHSHHSHSKKKKIKKIELKRKHLKICIAVLTLVVIALTGWNISLTVRLYDAVKKLENYNLNENIIIDSDTQSVPEFVKKEAESVVEQVMKIQNDDTVSFIAISDMHLDSKDAAMVNALQHAGMAMEIIRDKLDIDFAVNLGDITVGSKSTSIESGKNEIRKALEITKKGFSGIPNFYAVGNHDLLLYSYENNNDYLDSYELFDLIGKNNVDVVYQKGEEDRGYCYKDLEDLKLRVICLNTNDIKDVTDESVLKDEGKYCNMSAPQLEFVANALNLSSKADAKDWKIIVLSHIPLFTDGYEPVVKMLDDYQNGLSGVVSVEGKTVSYNFAGVNNAKLVCEVHGHLHNYRTDLIGKSKLASITVPNACYSRNNTKATVDSEEYRKKYAQQQTYEKVYNTAEDTAFSVITIDFKYSKIYVTNYGAGYDREVSF